MSKIIAYFQNSYRELAHVKWPTRRQLFEITGIVLLFSFGASFLIAIIDWALGGALLKLFFHA